jgi:hypothetical protein
MSTIPAMAQTNVSAFQDRVFVYKQEPGIPGSFPPALAIPDELLKKAQQVLGLTDAQLDGIRALVNVRSQNEKNILEELIQKQKGLEDLVSQNATNALEIGNAFLAVQAVESRLKSLNDQFKNDVLALLSTEQKQFVDNATKLATQIGPLRVLGLVDDGGGKFSMPGPMGFGIVRPAVGGTIRIERGRN